MRLATLSTFSAIVVLIAVAALLPGCAGGLDFIKKRLPPPERVDDGYLFRFSSPSAHVVQICGNWEENNWCNGQGETGSYRIGEMSDADGDGIWELVVPLESGRYEYKFIIDETNWKEDPNNPQRTDDGFGGFNSVLIVD